MPVVGMIGRADGKHFISGSRVNAVEIVVITRRSDQYHALAPGISDGIGFHISDASRKPLHWSDGPTQQNHR